jgi:hypothetical protein
MEITTNEVEQEVEFGTMSDEELEAVSSPASEQEKEDEPAAEGAEEQVEAEPEKTAAELKEELEAIRKEAEQAKAERDHWQKVRTEQEQNASAIRAAREELEKRIAANREKDPAQLFIDDPQSMMDAAAERARLEMQREHLGHQEKQYQQQQQIQQNAYQIDRVAPDLRENIDGIAEMLVEYGDAPEAIQAFRNNPAMFPADKVQMINGLYRERKAKMELQKQLEQYKTRGSDQLQKVEKASQRQTMTNSATGATSNGEGSLPENMSREDIAKLSDADLNRILGLT